MKPSSYNFFFQVDDRAILGYNSLTTALVELTGAEFSAFQEYSAQPSDDFFNVRGLGMLQDSLAKVGILVPDDCDELQQIKQVHAGLKEQGRRVIGLTIVPTLDCNFRCTYCFSFVRRERMSSRVQDALLRFVEQKLPAASGLSIAWFGGEPTLCLNLIEALSTQMRAACERHTVEFMQGDIITNGFLLTKEVAQRLKAVGITKAQVTLDGDRSTHDQRRPLQGGMGTFNRILDNVAAARDILDISIRINVDRSNSRTAVSALDALIEHGLGGMSAYFGHVKPFTEACAGVASDCLSDQEFSELNLSLTRQAIARGFASLRYPQLQLGGVCGAERGSSYLIAPDGLLFKCWAQASLGSEHSIGNIFDDQVTSEQQANLKRFLDWDPLSEQKCRVCRMLPICMGGCPYLRLSGPVEASCSAWRYSLLDTLALRYKMGRLSKELAASVSQEGGIKAK